MRNRNFKRADFCSVTYCHNGEEIFSSSVYARSIAGAIDQTHRAARVIWRTLIYLNGCPEKPFPDPWFRQDPELDVVEAEPLKSHSVSGTFLNAARAANVEPSQHQLDESLCRELIGSLVWSDPSLRNALLTGFSATGYYGGGHQKDHTHLNVIHGIGGKFSGVAKASAATELALVAITAHRGFHRLWGEYFDESDIEMHDVPSIQSATMRAAAQLNSEAKSSIIISYLKQCGHFELSELITKQSVL